mgnify:CR=1 FL=1
MIFLFVRNARACENPPKTAKTSGKPIKTLFFNVFPLPAVIPLFAP